MKICFFISTLSKGGAERVVANLSNFLCNRKEIDKVDIINTYNTKIEYELDSNINVYTLNKRYIEYKNLLNNHKGILKFILHIKKYFNNLKIKYKLKSIVKENNYDVIISFLPEPSFLLLTLKKYIKCPIIVSERNDPNIEYVNFRKKYLMKKLYPLADGFIFQTEDAKKYFDNIFTKKYDIIPNPVNDEFIVESYNGKREKTIVNVGRLTSQKNQLLLIKAFQKIKDKFSDYTLVIYGEGNLKKELQNYIIENKLEKNVLLAGQVDNIKEKIYKSSLFVLSSDYEGMPNALIEAMCLGLPVISTDCPCGGPKFLIENGKNGILVPIKDEQKLSNAIEHMLTNKEYARELSKNASKISNEVSSEIVNNKWLKFINEITKEVKK